MLRCRGTELEELAWCFENCLRASPDDGGGAISIEGVTLDNDVIGGVRPALKIGRTISGGLDVVCPNFVGHFKGRMGLSAIGYRTNLEDIAGIV